jgi:hypothetical protein
MSSVARSFPEQGQNASVRSRKWIVNGVRSSTPPSAARKPAFGGPQQVFTLSSVEGNGLGEETGKYPGPCGLCPFRGAPSR